MVVLPFARSPIAEVGAEDCIAAGGAEDIGAGGVGAEVAGIGAGGVAAEVAGVGAGDVGWTSCRCMKSAACFNLSSPTGGSNC